MGELRSTLSPKETLNHFSDLRCGRCHKIGNFISPIASLWLSLAAGALSVPLLGPSRHTRSVEGYRC